MQDVKGFVRLRKGIKEHLDEGRMLGQEWMVYSTLLLLADYDTGVCYKMSGEFLARLLNEPVRHVNRMLQSLEKKKYICRLKSKGRGQYYPIIINRFLTSRGLLIDARNTLSLKHIAFWPQDMKKLKDQRLSFHCPTDVLRMATIKELKKERK